MKHLKYIVIVLIVVLINKPISVSAHPGNTDKYGCHTCRTNCPKWGLEYNQYHCHNPKKTSITSTVKTTTTKIVKKSNNTNISELLVNDTKVKVSNNMTVNSYNDINNISIKTSDNKATVYYTKTMYLSNTNTQTIEVVAEDSTSKKYTLTINRIYSNDEIELSINKVMNKIIIPIEMANKVNRLIKN